MAPIARPLLLNGALRTERIPNSPARRLHDGHRASFAKSPERTTAWSSQALRHGPSLSWYCSPSSLSTIGSVAADVVRSPAASSRLTPDPALPAIVSTASDVMVSRAA